MSLLALAALVLAQAPLEPPPNIVVVLADDLGWGDVRAFNAASKVPTPNLDQLAREGLRFTDAHSPGAWCAPSRYGLLTGEAPWRKNGFRPNAGPVIAEGRLTLPQLLRDHGYTTAMVGKWHLGFEGGPGTEGEDKLGGPVDRGFDRFFGIHASLDIPPYYYLDGRRPTAPPTGTVDDRNTEGWTSIQGEFWRGGACAPDFVHAEVLPRFTARSVEWIEELAADDAPFFLYVALASPHTPWFSSGRYETGAGLYGDFVADTDAAVGELLAALERAGAADDTLVLFTSDNGPVWYPHDVERFGHSATGPFRGMKSDAWEGGHRMPVIARWPDRVPPGTACDETVCFTDLLATCADLIGAPRPESDGVSLTELLADPSARIEPRTLLLKADASVVRRGPWKLITHLGSGGFSKPRREEPADGGPTGQLYDLASDPGETTNLWSARPDVVEELERERRTLPTVRDYASLEAEYVRRVARLHADPETDASGFPAALAALAAETFGAYPGVVRAESERRLASLPRTTFAPGEWREHASWELPEALPEREVWQLFAWDPERLGGWAKNALLARELGTEAFGRRAMASAAARDVLYATGSPPQLVVESLGERFVVEVAPSDVGGVRPVRVRWWVRR